MPTAAWCVLAFIFGVVCGVGGLLVYLLFVQPSQYRGAGPVRSD